MIICAYINENFCIGILIFLCDYGIYYGLLVIRFKSYD